MRRRGLLHKTRLHGIIVLVVCFQLFGSYQIIDITPVKAEGTEPSVSIISPESGSTHNQTTINVTGIVENYVGDVFVFIYSGTKEFGPAQVLDGNWDISIDLEAYETHSFYAIAKGSEGIESAPSTAVSITIDSTSPSPIDITPPPLVTFVTPDNGAFTNSSIIEVTSEPLSTVEFCIDCLEVNGDVQGKWESVSADNKGKWVYNDPDLIDGAYNIYARAIDPAGNVGGHRKLTFTLDKSRPVVSPNVFPRQDMTQVATLKSDSIIKINIIESNLITDKEIIDKSITVVKNGSTVPIPGDINYNADSKLLTFTPHNNWSYSTKYNVIINPLGLIDSATNTSFPRFWSFTTETIKATTVNNNEVHELQYNGNVIQRESPHAVYKSNVNTCANCHSAHVADSSTLLDQKRNLYPEKNANLYVDDYCMACHDGTVAPKHENSESIHMHDAAINMEGKPSGSSCASCHNPHSEWSAEDPNLAQGHITYQHLPASGADKYNPNKKPTELTSSKEQLCESCHESDSGEKVDNKSVEYRLFEYNKWNSALGIYEDYDLCLRCHNPDFKGKYDATTDTARYYDYWTLEKLQKYEDQQKKLGNPNYFFAQREISLQEKQFSGHIIKAKDGSPLAGQIPCAECHDTHGSNNVKQLKTQIGHEKPTKLDALAAVDERTFCLTCHNGETAIYGITGSKIVDEEGISLNPEVPEHKKPSPDETNIIVCSECHSDSKSFVEAAHAPKRNINQ